MRDEATRNGGVRREKVWMPMMRFSGGVGAKEGQGERTFDGGVGYEGCVGRDGR